MISDELYNAFIGFSLRRFIVELEGGDQTPHPHPSMSWEIQTATWARGKSVTYV